jgi:hypothetical protein
MEELEAGKLKFLEVVKEVDTAVEVVIPTAPSNSLFLISLSKGPNRKFMTLQEDDMLDLPQEKDILEKTTSLIKETIKSL